ncbi:imm11 family protein [Ahrensia sp. R2A130]|uniref:imm11 family protein n=1 Tax=Ahrensia sp. R2A130 TaxID=744979 RepID=UPI001B3BC537|nr:DUF1629 domain-containing protein [Ahrensia sp. R2A130]
MRQLSVSAPKKYDFIFFRTGKTKMAATVELQHSGKFYRTKGECLNVKGERYKDGLSAWHKAYDLSNMAVASYEGVPVPVDIAPDTVRLTQGGKLYDSNIFVGVPLFSERFRQAVEDIEPGVHQFLPVKVIGVDGESYSEPWWSFNICQLVDSISPELGGVYKQEWEYLREEKYEKFTWNIKSGWLPGRVPEPDDSDPYNPYTMNPSKKLAVYKDRIAGRAAWIDSRLPRTFYSDALMARIEAEGMEGFYVVHHWKEI